MKGILPWVGGIIALIVLAFVLELGGLSWNKFFGVKREDVRREIFEATKSYNEGKEQDLIRYRMQYMRAETEADKEIIASTVRMMFADYDASKLEPELQAFLKTVRYGETKR